MECLFNSDVLQGSVSGPKRVPVTQSTQKPVSTPHTRVLGTAHGPQRIQRPVSQQKPAGVSVPVKTSCPGDQNVNPDQLKTTTQHKPQPKPVHVVEPNKATEPSKQDKPHRKHGCISSFFISFLHNIIMTLSVIFQKLLPMECPILPSKIFTNYKQTA